MTTGMTHYEILRVSVRAGTDEIRTAYRDRLLRFRHLAGSPQAPDPAQLDRLREAYEVLVDPAKRTEYDAMQDVSPVEPSVPPVPLVPAVPATAQPPVGTGGDEIPHAFRFVGEGSAYFRIWIVNLCLSIVTLGIYSAWAKVRREQYFHRNLLFNESAFDYHGKPQAILKGRAIAIVLLMLLSMAQQAGPLPYLFALLIIVFVAPALLIRALRFRAANTSYRSLRFSFEAGYGTAFKVVALNFLLTILTVGLWFPKLVRDWRKFTCEHSRFGSTSFACNLGVGQVYRIFLIPLLLFFVLSLVIGMAGLKGGGVFVILLGVGFYLLAPSYVMGRLSNLVWSSTTLGKHRFSSDIPLGRYMGVALSNWLGIICTLGLFIPWANVRMARLRAEHLTLHAVGSLDDFVAREHEQVSALGDGAADAFDMDLAL
jgi:uncharacterized membrane protein YjgN (DUF898 family)